jgi:hypothetical protein
MSIPSLFGCEKLFIRNTRYRRLASLSSRPEIGECLRPILSRKVPLSKENRVTTPMVSVEIFIYLARPPVKDLYSDNEPKIADRRPPGRPSIGSSSGKDGRSSENGD